MGGWDERMMDEKTRWEDEVMEGWEDEGMGIRSCQGDDGRMRG